MIFYRIHPEPLYTNPCIRKGPVYEKQLQPATALPLVSTGLLGEDVVALRNRKKKIIELLDFWYGSLEAREAREEKEQGGSSNNVRTTHLFRVVPLVLGLGPRVDRVTCDSRGDDQDQTGPSRENVWSIGVERDVRQG